MEARGEHSSEDRDRMRRIAGLFGVSGPTGKTKTLSIASNNDLGKPAKAS
jgi:hypothetical protein